MSYIPSVSQARELMEKYNKEDFHRKHAEIVSGVMGWFSERHDPDNTEYWKAVGMLHDIDFELYPEQHCVKAREILDAESVDKAVTDSVISHGYGLTGADVEPTKYMEKVLFASDELTGLIGAVAIMRPSKSVNDLETKSVKKKFKDKKFAAGCSREVIEQGAEMLGWDLDTLIEKTILAMRASENVD